MGCSFVLMSTLVMWMARCFGVVLGLSSSGSGLFESWLGIVGMGDSCGTGLAVVGWEW